MIQQSSIPHGISRPGVATTFGILNCILGGLGVVGPPFTLFQILVDPMGLYQLLGETFKIWSVFSTGLSFLASIWLLCCGIGLLKLRPWGRSGTIAYAIYALVFSFVGPAMVFLMATQIDAMLPPLKIGFYGGLILGFLFGFVYSILLLVFMTKPSMREAYG